VAQVEAAAVRASGSKPTPFRPVDRGSTVARARSSKRCTGRENTPSGRSWHRTHRHRRRHVLATTVTEATVASPRASVTRTRTAWSRHERAVGRVAAPLSSKPRVEVPHEAQAVAVGVRRVDASSVSEVLPGGREAGVMRATGGLLGRRGACHRRREEVGLAVAVAFRPHGTVADRSRRGYRSGGTAGDRPGPRALPSLFDGAWWSV